MVVLNQTLTLLSLTKSCGHGGADVITSRNVRASLNKPGINLAIRAEYVGRRIDLLAVIRRKDFRDDYNYAEVGGVRYRITSVSPTNKELLVRLVLSRE